MVSPEAYSYGVSGAVALAGALGVPAVSVAELGVAGGRGLLELQRLAAAVTGPEVTVTGFDGGAGMPAHADYRDEPYLWREGFYRMDEPALRARLGPSTVLRIGEAGETTAEFIAAAEPPLGFAAFDLDYYSSTAAAMGGLLNGPPERYLPRVLCYFDDTVGQHDEMHCEWAGELLAIAEFNAAHGDRKIARINGLACKRGIGGAEWAEGIRVLHLLGHPRYCDYARVASVPVQLPL